MSNPVRIRKAAVIGKFYPADTSELMKSVRAFIHDSVHRESKHREYHAVLVPHAGHVFCGKIAGLGFSEIARMETPGRLLFIGPSHYVPFQGIALSSAEYFELAALRFPVDTDAVQRMLGNNSTDGGNTQPLISLRDDVHEPEHSLEVLLPFAAALWEGVPILPMITGRIEPEVAAKIIESELRDNDLLIISSDLSHFYPAVEAVVRDSRLLSALDRGALDEVSAEEACGMTALLTAMHIAAKRNWHISITGYSHSGLVSGDMSQVVGYGSAVMYREV
ncbi:AmmeMemoRadiSam system protein B [Spirochaeta dissipatitropha]